MNIVRHSTRMTLALVAMSMASVAPATVQDSSTQDSTAWELKGLRLGSTMDEVKAAFPEAKCSVVTFDTSLSTCKDWNNSLAGGKAMVNVKLLDGVAVFISIENIDLKQADAAAVALTAKFGPATTVEPNEGHETERFRQRGIYTTADSYTWSQGDLFLEVIPFAWTSARTGKNHAAVVLRDEAKHDREWIVRYNNKGRPPADI